MPVTRTTVITLKATSQAIRIASEVKNPHIDLPPPTAACNEPRKAQALPSEEDQARRVFMMELDHRWALYERHKIVVPLIIIGFSLLIAVVYYLQPIDLLNFRIR